MKPARFALPGSALTLALSLAVIVAACSHSGGAPATTASPSGGSSSATVSLLASPTLRYPASAAAPTPDPRVGLAPGYQDAGEAIWNLDHVAHVQPSEGFSGRGSTGSDIAFTGKYAIMGNYRGFQSYDVSDPSHPQLVAGFLCPTSQGDPTVFGHLLFVSGEGAAARSDCGSQGVTDADSSGVSPSRFRGIRILDIADMAHPKIVANVQTCRGSHTNTLVTDPNDKNNVYIYVSGYSNVRSDRELAGCHGSNDPADLTSAQYRIEVIQVPLAHPEQARVVNTPHLLATLRGGGLRHGASPADTGAAAAGRGGRGRGGRGAAAGDTTAAGRGAAGGVGTPPDSLAAGRGRGGRGGRGNVAPNPTPGLGQNGCHDITSYVAIGYAGGACAGYGILFDVRDARNPKVLLTVADSNMSFWHSATFSNDGDKLLFSDEWGGGSQPRCRASDPMQWGGNAIFTFEQGQLHFKSYYKMPAPQTENETCTAHNGSLLPIPGREVMVQAFYQGGITLFDWTDASHPIEIGFFDRGPATGGGGGFWSAYWYNGALYGNDEGRGIDVWTLKPSPYLSQNEIDAARSVHLGYFNAQQQVRYVWPPSFALAGAYLDQLERNGGLPASRISAVRSGLSAAQSASGSARSSALTTLAGSIAGDINTAGDRGRVERLRNAVQDLARTK